MSEFCHSLVDKLIINIASGKFYTCQTIEKESVTVVAALQSCKVELPLSCHDNKLMFTTSTVEGMHLQGIFCIAMQMHANQNTGSK